MHDHRTTGVRNARLEAALLYADRGWPVFPCLQDGKLPLTQHGFKDATTNEDQIRRWWSRTPDANLGIALGVAGLVVIDPDRHEGKPDGLVALQELEKAHGRLPDAPSVETPSGGFHHYFAGHAKTRTLAPGLDLKGDGGYIIAPPSTFDGIAYRWTRTLSPDDLAPPELPDWVAKLAGRNESRSFSNTSPVGEEELRKSSTWLVNWMERKRSWFDQNGIAVRGPATWDHDNRFRYVFTPCPWNSEHNDAAAWVGVNDHGAVVAGCHHNSCPYAEANWRTLRVMVEGEQFALTDYGNAERLIRRHGENLLFVHDWRIWHVWDGRRYGADNTGETFRLIKETARSIYEEAAINPDEDRRKAIASHAARSESAIKLKAAVTLAESEHEVAVVHTDLNRNPYLFNLPNGTLNLRSGDLIPHDRAHRLTKIANASYTADAKCPQFESFLVRIMDNNPDLIDFLQRAIGYSMMALTSEQVFFFCYGTGANGKTTLIEVIAQMFGDYFQKAPSSMITQAGRDSDAVPNDLARLPGARFVVAAEVEEGRRMKEARIKDLTGGDTMVARFMRQEFFEFQPTHKLWIYGNHKPSIQGTDDAIWRRICMIPFAVTIPEKERDPALKERLTEELPGLLNWCLEGCRQYFEHGLAPPKEIKAATKEYRSEMDVVGRFLEEECAPSEKAEIAKGDLYDAYKEWADKSGERMSGLPMSKRRFGQQMAERGVEDRRDGNRRMWIGVKLSEGG